MTHMLMKRFTLSVCIFCQYNQQVTHFNTAIPVSPMRRLNKASAWMPIELFFSSTSRIKSAAKSSQQAAYISMPAEMAAMIPWTSFICAVLEN